jgi:phosphatidylglycerol:prolipoprotein diacylglycerol transferase
VQPELHLGPLTLQTFGIAFSLGFVASGLVIARRLAELGKPVDWAYEMILAALAGGLVGARAYFVVQHWDTASDDLLGSIFSGDGLVWYGGALGGAIAVCAWAYWRGFLSVTMLDVCAPALAIGYAIGRVGCQVSGDGDYGIASNLPWAMSYPHGTVPTDDRVHPTPIYESIAMALIAWGLWLWRDRVQPGVLFAMYLVASGTERLLVEFIRRNDEVVAGLTAPQLQSLVLIGAGVTWLAISARREPAPAR